ncbi:Galactoside 2-alpha-L-fucosyltransferase [Nymphaea thermarum]|nr:Galactoside 2-alpha-L-fucosyltransferase [Nymphaea thermarum]
MEKMIGLLLFISLFSLQLTILHGLDSPSDYGHSLPDLVQGKIIHCSSLSPDDKLLCQLEAALDAQGYLEAPGKNATQHSKTPPATMSCKFREDNVYSLYPYAMDPSPLLESVLQKYFAMHIRCKDIEFANLSDVYASSSGRPNCRYLIWRPSGDGLGNRLLSLVSSFLYAIMSARVLLIDYPPWHDLFCEPFLGSTIQLPAPNKLNNWVGHWYTEFRDARCGARITSSNTAICNDTTVNLSLDHDTPIREYESVSCPMGFARLRNVPFVYIRECNQYMIPGFYINPLLSPLLDVLFPQRNAFHLLARFLLFPNDAVWNSIKSNLDFDASRRIGVQIREFEKGKYTSAYDANIVRCIKKKGGFFPRRYRKRIQMAEYFSIFVATLEKHHVEEMNKAMRVVEEESGKKFTVKWQVVDGKEMHDSQHQKEALIDMWVLSMSHVLITSFESTFGYIATGLSGVVPFFLDKEDGGSCTMGNGLEPCFHAAPKNVLCIQEEPLAYSVHDMALNSSKVISCIDRPRLGWTVVSPM